MIIACSPLHVSPFIVEMINDWTERTVDRLPMLNVFELNSSTCIPIPFQLHTLEFKKSLSPLDPISRLQLRELLPNVVSHTTHFGYLPYLTHSFLVLESLLMS